MDTLIALLDERKQVGGSVYDSISRERAITRQADAVLRCASRAAVKTIRRLSGVTRAARV
jgi:hypothetical protein